jgi:hypothetical protein
MVLLAYIPLALVVTGFILAGLGVTVAAVALSVAVCLLLSLPAELLMALYLRGRSELRLK